jgi:hypothetical protein
MPEVSATSVPSPQAAFQSSTLMVLKAIMPKADKQFIIEEGGVASIRYEVEVAEKGIFDDLDQRVRHLQNYFAKAQKQAAFGNNTPSGIEKQFSDLVQKIKELETRYVPRKETFLMDCDEKHKTQKMGKTDTQKQRTLLEQAKTLSELLHQAENFRKELEVIAIRSGLEQQPTTTTTPTLSQGG